MGERASTVERVESGAADAPEGTPETAALRDDIEQTRAGMSGTIDAIQEKLDPEVLQEQAKDTIREAKEAAVEVIDHAIQQAKGAVREATIGKVEDMARYASETAGGWRQTLTETVKAHPIPAAIAGLSLGYLFLNRERESARASRYEGAAAARYGGTRPMAGAYGTSGDGGYRPGAYGGVESGRGGPSVTERAGDLAGRAQEAVGQAADQAQERVGEAVDTVQGAAGQAVDMVQEAAGQVAEQVQEQAHRAQGFLGRQLEEHPLAVGAVAVVLGGALGAAIGSTPREDRIFGTARDRVMGRAQEATQETLEKVERVVGEVRDTAGRAADEVKSTAAREARAQDLVPAGTAGASGSPGSSGNPGSASGASTGGGDTRGGAV